MPRPTDNLPGFDELTAARDVVYRSMPPTPQYSWPLLNQALGTDVWIKHENHTPCGAFKLRGGLTYFDRLARQSAAGQTITGVVAATRGNHGQSVTLAARAQGWNATIVVPRGNSLEKNAAMQAQGARLIEHGADFQESIELALKLADEEGLHMVPSYHRDLVCGVATYWMEFFTAQPLDVVFVPIGLGSGICAAVAARRALGLTCEIIGVVSSGAPAYRLSYLSGHVVSAPVTTVLADGMACRQPHAEAFEIIRAEVADVVQVSDDEVAAAIRLLFEATHNLAEGAGAAALAGALQLRDRCAGQRVGVVLSGANIDRPLAVEVLGG